MEMEKSYSLNEVAEVLEEKTHTIRHWTKRFHIDPSRKPWEKIYFTSTDIQILRVIKNLLRDQHYRIDGAKNVLAIELQRLNIPKQQLSVVGV